MFSLHIFLPSFPSFTSPAISPGAFLREASSSSRPTDRPRLVAGSDFAGHATRQDRKKPAMEGRIVCLHVGDGGRLRHTPGNTTVWATN